MRRPFLFVALLLAGCSPGTTSRGPTPAPAPSPKHEGDEVNNGGGLGEKNVLFAYSELPGYVRLCLASPRCDLTEQERHLMERISASLATHPPLPERIELRSERAAPGTFRPEGPHATIRSARTGDDPESPIWINRDHLYLSNDEPLDVPGAAALLLDEAAHHVDARFKDPLEHAKLDLLCTKLRIFLLRSMQSIDWGPRWRDFGALVVHGDEATVSDDLFIFDRDGYHVQRLGAGCPEPGEKLVLFTLSNLHWHSGKWREIPGRPFHVSYRTVLHAWITLLCRVPSPVPGDEGFVKPYRRDLLMPLHLEAGYQGEHLVLWKMEKDSPTPRIGDCKEMKDDACE